MGKRAWRRWVVVAGWCWLAASASGAEAVKPPDGAAADARWSDLTPLAIHQPFHNVRYPHLDAHGNVLFIADDAADASKERRHGIYRYGVDGALVCLVREGETTLPGSETEVTLRAIQSLQVDENAVDFVFTAYDSDKRRGLYHWSAGKLDVVARTGTTVLPGDTRPLNFIEYGTLHAGRVLYKAISPELKGAVVLHDLVSGTDRVLCHGEVPIPGRPGETFRSFGSTNWIGADSVVFRAGSAENMRGGAEARGTAGIYGWFGVKDWSETSPDLAPERLRTVVDGVTPVPVADLPDRATFDVLGSAPTNGGEVVFSASGQGYNGIFAARMPGGPVRCLIGNHTEIDDPFHGRFTSFGNYPAMSGQSVIFTATADEGADDSDDDGAEDARGSAAVREYHGVFVYRLDRGEIFALTDNRAPLGGKEIVGYEIGGHVLSGDRFAVAVEFKDGSSQICLGTLRPEARRQLGVDPTPVTPGTAR